MAQDNPKRVARKVLEKLGNGELVNFGEIAREVGYADNTADNPKGIRDTKAYQEEIAPFLNRMVTHRDKIMLELEVKDLNDEKHKDLVDSLDKLTKNIQLLSGGETERSGITFNVMNYGDTNPPPIST